MTRIFADNHLYIDFTREQWQLTDADDNVLFEAHNGAIQYSSAFAESHFLPPTLTPADVRQVVLGWSQSDESWRLGLTLTPETAEKRGSRWLELAHWEDDSAQKNYTSAQLATQALVDKLGLPVRIVPPRNTAKTTRWMPTPTPPVVTPHWQLEQGDSIETLLIRPTSAQLVSIFTRIAWYAFWAVALLLVSYASMTVKLALPATGLLPSGVQLPHLGIAAGVFLVWLTLNSVSDYFNTFKLRINTQTHQIEAPRPRGGIAWQMDMQQVRSVYVSQVVQQNRNKPPTANYSEINLLLRDGTFFSIIREANVSQIFRALPEGIIAFEEGVYPLSNIDSPMQAIAVHIAKGLGNLPCFYDYRKG